MILVIVLAIVLAAIYSEGSVDSPQKARSYRDCDLLAALAEEPLLYFSLLLSLLYCCCCIVVFFVVVVWLLL